MIQRSVSVINQFLRAGAVKVWMSQDKPFAPFGTHLLLGSHLMMINKEPGGSETVT